MPFSLGFLAHEARSRAVARRPRISVRSFGLWLAAVFVISAVVYCGSFERSAWILMTTPDAASSRSINSLWGYSGTVDGGPIQLENINFFHHLLMFSGGPVAQDFYILRPVYSFLASAFVPLVGWLPAMLLTNILSWAAGIFIVYLFAVKLTGQRIVGFWAGLLTIGGMGYVSHIHDYSAHSMAFTFFSLQHI